MSSRPSEWAPPSVAASNTCAALAVAGVEPYASRLTAQPDELIQLFEPENIELVVVGAAEAGPATARARSRAAAATDTKVSDRKWGMTV